MELIPTIFDKIKLPINVWKINDTQLIMTYTNNRIEIEKNVVDLDYYINKYKKSNKIKFTKFLKTKEKIEIENDNYNIILEFLNDDTFFEFFYPKSCTEYVLSSISYKIRTPLTNIIGLLQLLQNYNKNDPQYQNYINIIKNSSADIVSVANDIIDILNIKQNKLIAKKEEIILDNLIKECLRSISNDAEKKKINLLYKINKNVPAHIYSDKDKLKQIILNILHNAIEHINIGGITIDISLNSHDNFHPFAYNDVKPPKYNILFKIKDTGSGINNKTKEILNLILGIKDNITLNDKKLNGFGLFICKNLCELLNGNIWFQTKEDIGTIFFFNIICKNYD